MPASLLRCSVVLALAGAALAFRFPTPPPHGALSCSRCGTHQGRGRSPRFSALRVMARAGRSSRSGAAGQVRQILFLLLPSYLPPPPRSRSSPRHPPRAVITPCPSEPGVSPDCLGTSPQELPARRSQACWPPHPPWRQPRPHSVLARDSLAWLHLDCSSLWMCPTEKRPSTGSIVSEW